MTTLADRYRGALLGLAAGDALGTTLEFNAPGTFKPIADMVGGGVFKLKPGQWTDDTSMALCLAASLIDCRGFNAADQMDRYSDWRWHGYMSSNGKCFDIGTTCAGALSEYQKTGNPFSGSTDSHTAGNGSLMRLAPVVLAYRISPLLVWYAAQSSRTTHGADAAVDACIWYAVLICGALAGRSKEKLLGPDYYAGGLCPEIAAVARGSYKVKNPPAIKGSGYVVESLEAALWAFYHSDSFEEGALLAANLGNDADTTAAIYGQLAGAYYGAKAIPASWLEKLTMYEEISELADRLRELHLTTPLK